MEEDPTNPTPAESDTRDVLEKAKALLKRTAKALGAPKLDLDDEEGDDLYLLWRERQDRILKLLKPAFEEKILVWNGHFKNGELFNARRAWLSPKERLERAFSDGLSILVSDADLKRMEEANRGLLDPPVEFGNTFREFTCPYCEEQLRIGFDGERLLVVDDPCPHPDGLISEWELNVPSGRLVVANDLRHWFPSSDDHDVNYLIGQHRTTLGYAEVGMSHGFVSNTSPSVYQSGDKFVIGKYPEELWDEDSDESRENPDPCPWGEQVAGICTDLWWYSIVDEDELKRRVAHYTPEWEFIWEDKKITLRRDDYNRRVGEVIPVKPGVYRFRHPCGTNWDAPMVQFATFEWVREPDPLVDYLGLERAMNITALEASIEHCLAWPTLYMGLGYDDPQEKDREALVARWEKRPLEAKLASLAQVADHFMVVLGGGVEWHENGFPRMRVSEEARRLAREMSPEGIVPSFGEGRRHWYPISAGYGGLTLGAGVRSEWTKNEPLINLAPTFVLLGLNICQSAIKGGEEPQLNTDVWPPAFEVPFCRERMGVFGECYRGLRERYPNIVFDPEFDAWMQSVDFDRYVEDFDFGPTHPPEEKWGPPPATVKQGDYFEFDARKLEHGNFSWHPKIMGGANAHKKDAHRYSINLLAETMSPLGHLHHDYLPGRSNIPLWVAGRVVRGTGDGYLSKELEVAFDYGTSDMTSKRWSFRESDMVALRQFGDRAEYEELLEKCKTYFAEVEAEVDARVKKT